MNICDRFSNGTKRLRQKDVREIRNRKVPRFPAGEGEKIEMDSQVENKLQ